MLYNGQKFEFKNFYGKNHLVIPHGYFQTQFKNTELQENMYKLY